MLTGEIRGQVDQIWNHFWSGGIANPIEVIEQITYLLFIRRLDELQTLAELKAKQTRKQPERRIFPAGNDPRGLHYADLRWSAFIAPPRCSPWCPTTSSPSCAPWAATAPPTPTT